MASIDKVPTGYRVRYRNTQNRSRSKTFARKVDAEKFMVGVEHTKLSGTYVDPSLGKQTFGAWWKSCCDNAVDLRPSTRARDESYGRQYLLPAFETTQLSRIDHLSIRNWVTSLTARGLAPATVIKAKQLLGRTLASAVDAGLIAKNPAERVPIPRLEHKEMRFLNPSEVNLLARSIDPRYEAFVIVAAYAGLRFSEMAGLKLKRIDFLHSRIEVTENAVEVKGHIHIGPPKTNAGRRSVPLPKFAMKVLEHHCSEMSPESLVFPAPNGGPLRASLFRRRIWIKAVEAAGIRKLRPHDLRHTAVALWIEAGASPTEVASRAGHSSVVTVLDRYGHLLPGSEDRVNDALELMATLPNKTIAVITKS